MTTTTYATKMKLLLTALTLGALAGCADHAPPPAPAGPAACAAATCPTPAPAAPTVAVSPQTPASPGAAAAPAAGTADKSAPGPAQAEPARPKGAQHASAADLRVKRFVLTPSVENREPTEARTSFDRDETGRIYAFVELENQSREPGEIIVAFEPPDGGALRGNVKLEVGPHPRFRTWAFTRGAREVGNWTAVVMASNGEILARAPFEVTL